MTTLNLAAFCGQHDIRGWMNQPIIVDDYMVATNGHILVAMPLSAGSGQGPNPKWSVPEGTLAHLRGIIAAAQADSLEARLRVQAHDVLPRLPACAHCAGTGVVYEVDCDECDGVGTFDHGSHEYSCKHCNATGRLDAFSDQGNERPCPECEGMKVGNGRTTTPGIGQGQLHLATLYAALICTHIPDAEICAVPSGDKGIIYFRSATDNVFGAVMPIKVSLAKADELDRAVDWRAD